MKLLMRSPNTFIEIITEIFGRDVTVERRGLTLAVVTSQLFWICFTFYSDSVQLELQS